MISFFTVPIISYALLIITLSNSDKIAIFLCNPLILIIFFSVFATVFLIDAIISNYRVRHTYGKKKTRLIAAPLIISAVLSSVMFPLIFIKINTNPSNFLSYKLVSKYVKYDPVSYKDKDYVVLLIINDSDHEINGFSAKFVFSGYTEEIAPEYNSVKTLFKPKTTNKVTFDFSDNTNLRKC